MQDCVSGEQLSEEEEEVYNVSAIAAKEDSTTFEEAILCKNWREAMKVEMDAIHRNNTWTLIDLPAGLKVVGVKWIFKTKYNEAGQVDKYKARLVAKGYTQQYGVDFTEVYAPIAR